MATGWRPVRHDWPSPKAQWVADRLGITPAPAYTVDASVIIEVDLATGARLRTVLAHSPPFQAFAVDPTGDAIVTHPGQQGPFIEYSARWGFERRRLDAAFIPQEYSLGDAFSGFTADGSAVYIRVSDSEFGPTARIVRWSLVDGSTSVVAEVPITMVQLEHGRHYCARRAFVIPGKPDRIVALAEGLEFFFERSTGPMLTMHDGAGPPKAARPKDPTEYLEGVAVTHDGAHIYLSTHRGLLVVDPDTLATIEAIDPPARAGRTDMFGMYVHIDPSDRLVATMGPGGDTVELYDTQAHAWHTPLDLPPDILVGHGVHFSSDGLFAAAGAFSAGGSYSSYTTDLVIWHLLPVRVGIPPSAK